MVLVADEIIVADEYRAPEPKAINCLQFGNNLLRFL